MAATKPDNTYRLVVFHEPQDPRAVRDLLCAVTGDHPTDAAQWVARTPGIWARPLAEGEVRELLDGLYELGMAAEARRIDTVPNLFPPRTVHEVACLADGLRISGLRGEAAHWVPWDKVDLLHAGRVEADEDPGVIDWSPSFLDGVRALTHRPGSLPPRPPKHGKEARPPVGEVHVVRDAPRMAFRIVENAMNYAYLGERLRQTASENFRLLLGDLVTRSTRAFVTPETLALRDGRADGVSACVDPQELLRETTLKLLWSWYRRDREAAGT